jgi:hypothetical protein
VNVATKEQSKQWMHTNSPKRPKKFNQMLFKRKLVATVVWNRKQVLVVTFLNQWTKITSQVYCETTKKTT